MTEYLELRESVLAANLALPAHGLIKLTWGNVSEIDRDLGVIAIKPSGVSYGDLTAADIVVLDLAGNVIDGEQSPSTDTPTHVALYQAFEEIGAVVHTHSTWATVFAQAQREIPLYGTTHADLCAEPIPVTRALTEEEIEDGYELHTGTILIEEIARFGPEPIHLGSHRGQGDRERCRTRADRRDGVSHRRARADSTGARRTGTPEAPRPQARPERLLRPAVTLWAAWRPRARSQSCSRCASRTL
jgi:L-ribulose-5-phosphate 4-epimerase